MSSRRRDGIADLAPGYAALVMATGIVSTGFALFGWRLLSGALLAVAVIALAALLVAYVWRVFAFPHRVLADARDPGKGFGFFTLVAAPNVLGVRVAMDGHLAVAAILAVASVPVWLVLTYAVPGALIVGERTESVLPRADGSWFLWVVGTQALATAAATLVAGDRARADWLGPVAVALWGIGVVLYLMLIGLVMVRLLGDPVTPHALSPTYWVYMGATAITVLAAAKILGLPAALPVLGATRPVVSGLAFLLWAFGTWWIPLLLIFAVWRHAVRRGPTGRAGSTRRARLRHEPSLWSMVFPLGMYGAASASFGKATGLGFMVAIARVEIWVGLAAWFAVAVVMVRSFLLPPPSGREVSGPAVVPRQTQSREARSREGGAWSGQTGREGE